MPSTSALYCIGANMMGAFVSSVTNAATGFPKEHLLDLNPDTYWKATGVGTVSIVTDLGSAKTIQGWALWLHNAHVDLNPGPGTQQVKVYHSPDNSAWTLWDTVTLDNVINQPIFFGGSLTEQSKRYWKVEILAPDLIVEVSMIFLYTKHTISQANQRPDVSSRVFVTRKMESSSGRVFVAIERKTPREMFSRQYTFATGGDQTTLPLVKAFNDSSGDAFPLILVDDSAVSSARLVRFARPELQIRETHYQVYDISVDLHTESFVSLGSTT